MNAPSPALSDASFSISRRRFLQTASASLAMSALGARGVELVNQKPKRVALIGAGWYGKSDTWRLLQVAPAEIVGIADIEQGHTSTASCILANVAMKLGRPLSYDPAKREIVGDAAAT